jgi:hypothetical protein
MEAKGLVRSRVGEPTAARGGRASPMAMATNMVARTIATRYPIYRATLLSFAAFDIEAAVP